MRFARLWKTIEDRDKLLSVDDWSQIASIAKSMTDKIGRAVDQYFIFQHTSKGAASRLVKGEWEQFMSGNPGVKNWHRSAKETSYAIFLMAFSMRSDANYSQIAKQLGVQENEAPRAAKEFIKKIFFEAELKQMWRVPYLEATRGLIEGRE